MLSHDGVPPADLLYDDISLVLTYSEDMRK